MAIERIKKILRQTAKAQAPQRVITQVDEGLFKVQVRRRSGIVEFLVRTAPESLSMEASQAAVPEAPELIGSSL